MAKAQIFPLSAVEIVDAEREARLHVYKERGRGRPSVVEKWATLFLRMLELHRAAERQSLILQGQVASLSDELEALGRNP